MGAGRVLFVGCGPGAPDLLTLRAVDAIARADVVIWSPTLLDEAVVVAHARAGAELMAWPPATQNDVLAVYDRALTEGLQVVRCKGGDPTLFSELGDDLRALRARGLEYEIVPGVSAVTAAAATLGREIAGIGKPLLVAVAGDHPEAGAGVVALLGAGRDPAAIAAELAGRGWPPATPCAVVAGLSRPAEIAVACRLDELAEAIADYGLGGLTTVLAGPGLEAAGDPPRARPPTGVEH
jgi:precorrin-4 methylase